MPTTAAEVSSPRAAARRFPWFLLGLVVFFAGPVAYAIQLYSKRLTTPWYLPVLMTVGVLLMLISVVQRRGVMRMTGFAVFAVLCSFIWFLVLAGMNTPEYQGPVAIGQKLPPFTASLADGASFTRRDLEAGKPSVLVFFRGRW